MTHVDQGRTLKARREEDDDGAWGGHAAVVCRLWVAAMVWLAAGLYERLRRVSRGRCGEWDWTTPCRSVLIPARRARGCPRATGRMRAKDSRGLPRASFRSVIDRRSWSRHNPLTHASLESTEARSEDC